MTLRVGNEGVSSGGDVGRCTCRDGGGASFVAWWVVVG